MRLLAENARITLTPVSKNLQFKEKRQLKEPVKPWFVQNKLIIESMELIPFEGCTRNSRRRTRGPYCITGSALKILTRVNISRKMCFNFVSTWFRKPIQRIVQEDSSLQIHGCWIQSLLNGVEQRWISKMDKTRNWWTLLSMRAIWPSFSSNSWPSLLFSQERRATQTSLLHCVPKASTSEREE